MAKAKLASRRGNAELHAQAIALSLHTWNNTVADWQALEEVVTQLGAAAPKAAKEALASRQRSMRKMPNPWRA
jgi:dihydroxyacid dehydratase/phosphogluconate dehydratase